MYLYKLEGAVLVFCIKLPILLKVWNHKHSQCLRMHLLRRRLLHMSKWWLLLHLLSMLHHWKSLFLAFTFFVVVNFCSVLRFLMFWFCFIVGMTCYSYYTSWWSAAALCPVWQHHQFAYSPSPYRFSVGNLW